MTKINIGLLGFGTVGKGVYRAINSSKKYYSDCYNINYEIKKILVSDITKKREGVREEMLTDNYDDIVLDKDIDIIIEVMGTIDVAKDYILKAFDNKKHVISANKDMISLYKSQLEDRATKNNCFFRYEASVAGGLPAVDVAKEHFSGEKVTRISAILNGTTNYILSTMCGEEGKSYVEALSEAQKLGFAESDPTSDVEGLDSARKLAILSSIYFKSDFTCEDVYTEGISHLDQMDIQVGKKTGHTVKLLAKARDTSGGVQLMVYPAFVKEQSPFASIEGGYNMISLESEFLGKSTYVALGAGAMPTASAVVSDLMNVTSKIAAGDTPSKHRVNFPQKKLMDALENQSGFYINIEAKGVDFPQEKILKYLLDKDLKISCQLELESDEDTTNLGIIIEKCREKKLQDALDDLTKNQNLVVKKLIRIEEDL